MALAWPSAARLCSRAWRANVHRIHTAIMPQGCNTDQYGSWESIYVCILMWRGKEKQVFLAEHNFCEPINQSDCRSKHRFASNISSFNWVLPLELQRTAAAPLVHRENEHVFPKQGRSLWCEGMARFQHKGSLFLGHLRSLLGKHPTAPFPRKSGEQAYSLLQHLLKTLFSVKCLKCW